MDCGSGMRVTTNDVLERLEGSCWCREAAVRSRKDTGSLGVGLDSADLNQEGISEGEGLARWSGGTVDTKVRSGTLIRSPGKSQLRSSRSQ